MNSETPKTFRTILIGVAFSPNLKNNIYEAMRLVDFFDCRLILVHVGEKTSEREKELKQLISGFSEDNEKVKTVWKQGDPVEVIINTAKDEQADLIMLGAIPREDLLKFYIGSIARKITRKAHCSVLLLINPSEDLRPCNHIVVNDPEDDSSSQTIMASLEIAQNLGSQQLTIVEEISQQEVQVVVEDDESLRKDTMIKEQLARKRDLQVQELLKEVPDNLKQHVRVKTQPIFGKRGYSIGHYAKVVGADMLIMNAPVKTSLWDRIFPHDMEYILSELPTDVLIVR